MSHSIQAKAEALLVRHGLKRTTLRTSMLETLLGAKEPLSQAQLLELLGSEEQSIDRVSVYRNLHHLKSLGLVHEVEHNHYVACSHECEDHPHLLLFCQDCQKHQEVKDHGRIEKFVSVLGDLKFFGKAAPFFLKGLCSDCSKKA